MTVLSLKDVDLGLVVIAGLIAGYVMSVIGLWGGSIPGLVTVDIADFGRRYMISDRLSAWMLGLASHLVNSVLLVLVLATLILPNLHWPRLLVAVVWGEFLALTLAGVLVAPMSGLGVLGFRTGNHRFALTTILMHAAWGILVGMIYLPRA